MKNFTILSIAIICLSLLSISAKKKNPPSFSMNKIEKSFAKVDSNLYASKYEVNNIQYKTFFEELKAQGDSKLIKMAKVDTSNWISNNCYCEPLVEYYFQHPAYANYPVVNISYEGAQLFCTWLTKKYNSYPKRKFEEVLIRLPTKEEWQKAAIGTLTHVPYPWGGIYIVGECNFNRIYQASIHYDKVNDKYVLPKPNKHSIGLDKDLSVTCPVDKYKGNSIDIYNISGNVAEMIQEKGVCCGGGWRSCGYDVRIKSVEKYSRTDIDLGFRYFIEIIKE